MCGLLTSVDHLLLGAPCPQTGRAEIRVPPSVLSGLLGTFHGVSPCVGRWNGVGARASGQAPWRRRGGQPTLCSVAAPGNKPELYEVSGGRPPGQHQPRADPV